MSKEPYPFRMGGVFSSTIKILFSDGGWSVGFVMVFIMKNLLALEFVHAHARIHPFRKKLGIV
jgi:hypothetical protein